MSGDMLFVFATVAVAAVLFASNRVRLDIVALLVVLAMMLSGVLTPAQSLAGFGDTVVLLVAGLLVVGEMLDRTGIAQSIGAWIIRTGGRSETRLLVLIMLAAAALSSVMSSTAVVAIFIPIVFKVAANTNIRASRLLMPMSFAAMISGMLTLIATTPNLVVSSELAATPGYASLGFFSFMPIGLVVLAVGILYILTPGRRLLSIEGEDAATDRKRSISDLWSEFQLDQRVDRFRLTSGSSLAGHTVGSSDIEQRYNVRILTMEVPSTTGRPEIKTVQADDELSPNAVLMVCGAPDAIDHFEKSEQLVKIEENARDQQRILQEQGIGVILIHPDCRYIGKSLRTSSSARDSACM
jgi:di/tricarboxylate transporter